MKPLVPAAAVLVLLSGCGDSTPAAAPSTTASPATSTAAPTPRFAITSPVEGGPRLRTFTVPVKGTGTPGDRVRVTDDVVSASTTVGADGRWTATLDMSANQSGATAVTATSRRSGQEDAAFFLIPHGKEYARAQAERKARRARQRQQPSLSCEEPSGQEKASLRFAVGSHDSNNELRDSPWAIVRSGGKNYMAAELDYSGPRAVLLVVFSDKGQYLAGTKAVNGTARTFTDLPEAGSTIPKAGEKALDCMG